MSGVGQVRRGWLTARVLGTFLLLVLGLTSVASTRVVGLVLHDGLTRLITMLSAPVLALFGEVRAGHQSLRLNEFRASVESACDGLQPTCIYLAAVLAFPSGWRDKLWGIAIGLPAIFLVNLARVVTMMLCGSYWPALFEQVHLYGWQALVIVLTIAVWVFWAERFARPSLLATP